MAGAAKNTVDTEAPGKVWTAGNVRIEVEFRRVLIEKAEVALTSREFELLLFLVSHLERPFEREQLIRQVWNYDFMGDVRVVDDLVKRIRRKLSDYSASLLIDTVWGFGYKASVRQA
ncbi:Transcriptional regulatory protein SrrA [compost metagenome]